MLVWQAESLRLSAFPSPATAITEPTWWTDLLGEPPERKISRPKMGGQQEEGPLEIGKLRLVVQPTRVDWVFGAISPKEEEAETFPTIGPFPKTLDTFLRLMFGWFGLETCPSLKRLAFGAILFQPVDNRKAGYKQLSTYLHAVKLDPERSSDFTYQINRPRDSTSGVPGLRINRLSKWSVSLIQTVAYTLETTSVSLVQGRELSVCRIELDINTTPDFQGELSREQLPGIFKELVDLGFEISEHGDIP